MKAYGVALGLRGGLEYFGGDEAAGNSATVEFLDVMQTARRTGPSVGQAFNDDIALACDLLHQADRRRSRKRRLLVALGLHAPRRE